MSSQTINSFNLDSNAATASIYGINKAIGKGMRCYQLTGPTNTIDSIKQNMDRRARAAGIAIKYGTCKEDGYDVAVKVDETTQ